MSIPIDMRSQAHRVVSFYQTEKRDTDWLDDYYGELTEEIFRLPPLECLDFHKGVISRYRVTPKKAQQKQQSTFQQLLGV
jgi:hypothetical protein